MTTKVPFIGFDRYVDLSWCEAAFDLSLGSNRTETIQKKMSEELSGKESQRKTLDILNRISINPFAQCEDFIKRGLLINQTIGSASIFPIAWGASISSYPFFGKTAETIGRLFILHGDCSIKEIQRRMSEYYGQRDGIERAVSRVIQTQSNWGAFQRDSSFARISIGKTNPLESSDLCLWLIEAVLRYSGKPLEVANIFSQPVLFPFVLSGFSSYSISRSQILQLHSEGPGIQYVSLR